MYNMLSFENMVCTKMKKKFHSQSNFHHIAKSKSSHRLNGSSCHAKLKNQGTSIIGVFNNTNTNNNGGTMP